MQFKTMLEVKLVSKEYGKINALSKVSLKINKGEFFGLLGPNGAGKTTLINIISLLVKPDSGEVHIGGNNVNGSLKKSRRQIGLVPQEIALYEELTAMENLKFWGRAYGIREKELKNRSQDLLQMTGLTERSASRVSTFSGGMKRRLNIACALIHKPEFIIMDEPTVGVDPQSREFVYDMLTEFHQRGHTILYTSHYLDEFEKLCDRVAIIDKGNILAKGTIQEIRKKYAPRDIIFISTRKTDPEKVKGLKQYDYEYIDDRFVFRTTDANKSLPIILEKLNRNRVQVKHINIKKSGLETVFFNLTGTYLRD